MKKKLLSINKGTIIYLISLFTLTCIFLVIIFINHNYNKIFGDTDAVNGHLSVSDSSLNKTGFTYIDGYWRIYYNQLILSDHHTSPANESVKLPNARLCSILTPAGIKYNNNNLFTCASYQLTVDGLSKNYQYYITLPSQLGSYAVWVNGNMVNANCFNGQNFLKSFTSEGKNDSIVIELKNSTIGGIYTSPKLITYEVYNTTNYTNKFIGTFSLGGFIFFLCAFIFIFLTSRKDKKNLSIVIFMFVTSLRYQIYVLGLIFPDINHFFCLHDHAYSCMYLITFTLFSISALYMSNQCFNLNKWHEYENCIVVLACVFTETTSLSANPYHFNISSKICIILGNTLLFLCISKCIIAINKKINGSLEYSFAILFASFGIFWDVIKLSGKLTLETNHVVPICLIIMLLAISIRKRNADIQTHTALLEAKLKKTQQMNEILLLEVSNVKPHFIYNTLGAIQYLCRHDTTAAQNAIVTFSNYLRHNVDSVNYNELIAFEDELEHIKNYIQLSNYRYNNKINFITDFECTDFVIPPLSIATIVENALTHGISKNENGGTISLCTMRKNGNIIITIQNDGPVYKGEPFGVGLNSSSTRIKQLIDGTFTIKPLNDTIGTIVTITIPDNK